ncbi:MAG: S1 RNA-binding domain-containing protein [Candidatus Firestonebacteria bacterium]
MAIKLGEVVEGTITKITNYGAFVDLPDGKRGLVHISEVSQDFVKDINDFLKERQKIKVKILAISPDNRKIDLSLKQVSSESDAKINTGAKVDNNDRKFKHEPKTIRRYNHAGNSAFEEMLSRFMKTSEEKLTDLKNNIESKRGGTVKKQY